MSATRRPTTALVTALLIAVLALPAAAVARPAADPGGAKSATSGAVTEPVPAAPAPAVADDGTDVLPIVLGGAALILALGGAGYVLLQASHRRQPQALR
jgi:hypothetical protein